LWSVKERREVRGLVGHEKDVEALAFSPAGNVLVSGSADGTVRFWHVEEGRELARAPSHRTIVYALAVAPDFGFVASAGDDQVIRIDDVPREARRVERPR
ncbi:MAG TPA: WD40 repeat domain-containing protein, partial [Planctomycetota bacterium]|nr:WD40 repeat domain-containing protein [Planctomycetota bacterium]